MRSRSWLLLPALLALPLIGLYMGGAGVVRLIESRRDSGGDGLMQS